MNFINTGFYLSGDEVNILFNFLLGLLAGGIISIGYILGHRNKKYSKNFTLTLFLLPGIMAVVIPFIATDLKKAVSLAGVFALVRFRSIPGDSKDILYVFFALTIGIIIGLNSYVVAFAVTIAISLIFVLVKNFWKTTKSQILRITIPEDMNYSGAFDDIFAKYLKSHSLANVKTTNMGTLFTVSYNVQMKNLEEVKPFIDELRTRNGNLNIVLSDSEEVQFQTL